MSAVPLIRALGRGLEVLELISQRGAIRKSQIAATVGMPYPTVNRIVHTLLEDGYLELADSGKLIRVSARVQALAHGFQRTNQLVQIANPILAEFTQRFDWPMALVSRLGSSMVVMTSTHEQTPMTFRHFSPGFVFPMLDSVAGRVYLAFCTDEEREACFRGIATSFPNQFDNAIAIAREGKEYEEIRRTGVGVSRLRRAPVGSMRNAAIAAPFFDESGVCGALAMVFFASAMTIDDAVERYADEIKLTASELSKKYIADQQKA
jgi:IclR family transcriptional regulator, mhp operon transcriptional activator